MIKYIKDFTLFQWLLTLIGSIFLLSIGVMFLKGVLVLLMLGVLIKHSAKLVTWYKQCFNWK